MVLKSAAFATSLTSANYWIDVAERAVRNFAQGTLIGLGVSSGVIPGVHLPWASALLFGMSFSAIEVLVSLSSIPVPGADPQTASFLPADPATAIPARLAERKQ